MPPAESMSEISESLQCSSSSMNSRFSDLRGVRWRINLGVLPSFSSSIDDLRRVMADSRRRYAALRRCLLVDPHVNKFSDDSSDLVVDNPLSQNPDSTWGRFFRNAELEKMVDKDLSRLYPEHGSYFQTPACQCLLRRILLLWCLRHPECGYRQGMHELLAPLLYVLHADIQHLNEVRELYEEHFVDKFDEFLMHETHDFNFKISSNTAEDDTGPQERSKKHKSLSELDANVQTIIQLSDPYGAEGELGIVLSEKFMEHDAYCMFDALMSGAGGAVAMAEFFSHPPASATQTGMPPVIEASLTLYHLLSIVDSSLYNHLVELGVEPQYFALRWLRVLFGREFSLEDLLVIWDEIFSFDNSASVTAPANDPGVLNSPRGAFISAMAVSMMLSVRSSLLATEYAASCLQRLLNFPENIDLGKLIEKAKSLVPLALAANVPSHSTPMIGHGYQSKQLPVKGYAHSLSFDSKGPGTPVSVVPERYWEEKWRVAQEEEKTKKENSAKQASSQRKGWTEKIKSKLSRTESDPSPSRKEIRQRDKKSTVRRSLLEDLSKQLNIGDDSEETGDDKLSSLKDPLFMDSDESGTYLDKTGSGLSNASEEHSPAFSGPLSPPDNDSEKSSLVSNNSHDTIDSGIQDSSSFQSMEEEPPLPISDAPDANPCGVSGSDSSSSKEVSVTVSKERKGFSGKFPWLWKFGRPSSGDGTSDKSPEVENERSDDAGSIQVKKPGSSVDEKNYSHASIKSDSCDQKMLCTLRNLGQSMMENIQVIESALQQEKGQVTAMTALKELRNISNLLQEM
ncbi:TBC1 domain family member 5-like protein A [Bienertia sinuspersici]